MGKYDHAFVRLQKTLLFGEKRCVLSDLLADRLTLAIESIELLDNFTGSFVVRRDHQLNRITCMGHAT